MVHRIRSMQVVRAGLCVSTTEHEELLLDVKWWQDGKTLLWSVSNNECLYGTISILNYNYPSALKLPMLPFTVNKSQLGRYMVLI